MAPAKLLGRNIRPIQSRGQESDSDVLQSDVGRVEQESDEEDSGSEDRRGADHSDNESLDDENVEHMMKNVAFGALKGAQDSLSKKRKREQIYDDGREEKLAALRARLEDMRSTKAKTSSRTQTSSNAAMEGAPSPSDDDDSAPSEEGAPSKSRTSKHAPAEQTSRRQVTRKRTVVDVPKRVTRDPRFDALHRSLPTHPGNSEKAYGFLVDYQKSEIAELQAAMKKTKSPEDKETLKKKIVSMQNRLKAKENAEREQEVLRKHRKEERDKVQQGKTPYFLKNKEVKERALVEKFKGMKGKDREKLMERRRKKEGQKEKRRMPEARRGVA